MKRPRAQALAAGTIFEIIVTDKFTAEDRKIFKIFFAGNICWKTFGSHRNSSENFHAASFSRLWGEISGLVDGYVKLLDR